LLFHTFNFVKLGEPAPVTPNTSRLTSVQNYEEKC